jgi:soluble lytic murein transglycosylase-like protein
VIAAVTRWDALIAAAAAAVGLPFELLQGLVRQESAGDPDAVSHVGASGLTQLMPGTADELGVENPFDPEQALSGGARYLAARIREFDGDVAAGLAAYNAGAGNVRRRGRWPEAGWLSRMPAETRDYVPKVLGHAGWMLVGELAVPPRGAPVDPAPGGGGLPPAAVVLVGAVLVGAFYLIARS